jgi:hypothetical protein
MASLKQIEVNGTTYDIGIPGSQLPVVCEVYGTDWSGDTLADKMNSGLGDEGSVHYEEISSNILVKQVQGQAEYVVIAVPDDAIS